MGHQLDFFSRTNSYHNTLPIVDEKELDKREEKAKGQDKQILEFFESHKHESFTPAQIHLLFAQKWPLTSVRRSLTNLSKAGKLLVTGEKRPGYFGEPNNCWRLKTENNGN